VSKSQYLLALQRDVTTLEWISSLVTIKLSTRNSLETDALIQVAEATNGSTAASYWNADSSILTPIRRIYFAMADGRIAYIDFKS